MVEWYASEGPQQDVVLSTRVRFARNFTGIPFPNKCTEADYNHVISAVEEGLRTEGRDGRVLRMSDMPALERNSLVETHLISMDLAEKETLPCGVMIGEDGLSVMVNEEDHLRIQCILPGYQLQEAYQKCLKFESLPCFQKQYAFSPEFGYLTSCPTNVGTAIRASAMLHLPALVLTDKIKEVLDSCGKLGIAVRGIYGENSNAVAHCFQISNQFTLGHTEDDNIINVNNIITQICTMERNYREYLYKNSGIEFEDRVFRAYGILTNARIISAKEALSLLSEVKMGVDLKIISGTDVNLIKLMTMVQPATLQKLTGRILDSNERDQVRALVIKRELTEQPKNGGDSAETAEK